MILITGATGLVGSHLALHLLENNERIRAIYRTKTSIEKAKFLLSFMEKKIYLNKLNGLKPI
jgi:dihydroflavonol-4-reductase